MTTMLDDTLSTAKKTVNEVRDTVDHSASVARSTLLDGLHVAASTLTMLRSLGIADALGWVGLERRRGPIFPMLTFGAGFLAGAAVTLLAAPMSGAEMRRRIAQRAMGIEHEAEETAKSAVHKAEDTVDRGIAAAKDAVKSTIAATEDALKDGANGGKQGKASPPSHRVS